jgi:hypothetical protein
MASKKFIFDMKIFYSKLNPLNKFPKNFKEMSAANSEEGVHFVLYRKAHFFVGDSTHPSNARFGRQTTDRSIRCKPGLFTNEHRRVLSATVEGRNGNGTRNGEIAAKIRYRNKAI